MTIKKWRWPVMAGMLISLTACSQLHAPDVQSATPWPTADKAALNKGFDGAGRLALKDYGKGSYANFSWQNQGTVQTIEVTTPLGNSVGQLCRDSQGVIAKDSRGQIETADNIEELSQRLLGFALPFDSLDLWTQGYRIANLDYQIDSDGRLSQSGWVVRRQLRKDGQTLRLLQLNNPRFEIKLLFDEYQNAEIAHGSQCGLRTDTQAD